MQDHRLTAAPGSGAADADGKRPDPLQPLYNELYTYPDDALMRVRQFIDKTLTIDIGTLDLAEELGMQYRQGKALLAAIQMDDAVPANQKAQVYNTVQAQLDRIIKMREEVYSQERLKRYEGAFLKAMAALPDDNARHIFFDLYGEYLKDPNAEAKPALRLPEVKPK